MIKENGLVERTNHVLADMLSMYVDGEHKLLDEALPFVTFAYNVSKQESTGFSPIDLVNCREAILPIDVALATNQMQLSKIVLAHNTLIVFKN